MIFNIPKWTNDNIIHYATTWVLSYDPDRKNIIQRVDESSNELIAWEPNIVIPTGEIWYVSALRHLKTTDGKLIENNEWIGPTPVINEESTSADVVLPKFIATKPIVDVKYKYNDYIELKIKKPACTTKYIRTVITFMKKTDYGLNIQSIKNVTLPDNEYTYKYTIQELHLDSSEEIVVEVRHMCNQYLLTDPYTIKLGKYGGRIKLDPEPTNLDPYRTDLKIKIESIDDTVGIESFNLSLKDENGRYIASISGIDEIDLTGLLDYNKVYYGYLTYTIKIADNSYTYNTEIPITTKKFNISIVNEDLTYSLEKLRQQYVSEYIMNTQMDVLDNIPYTLTEDKWGVINYDSKNKLILKDSDKILLEIGSGSNIRFITKNIGVFLTYRHSDESFWSGIFKIDYENNSYKLIKKYTFVPNNFTSICNNIVKINDKVYTFYYEDGELKYRWYSLVDFSTGVKNTGIAIKGVPTVTHIANNKIALSTANDDNVYTYDIKNNIIYPLFTLPDEVKDGARTFIRSNKDEITLIWPGNHIDTLIVYNYKTGYIKRINTGLNPDNTVLHGVINTPSETILQISINKVYYLYRLR